MSEKITPQITLRVAELSRLALDENQVEQFSNQLSSILQHADDISALDLEGIEPTSHPYPLKNVLREDVVKEGTQEFKDAVLAVAPSNEKGQFKVPSILG